MFPKSNKYDSMWILKNSMGFNALNLTEWLTQAIELKPGMKVLDLGCGKGISSVFLAKEFGIRVWAVDLWEGPSEKQENAIRFRVDDLVIPERGDARNLPYAENFFDAVICVDSYIYYGTDDLYLNYILSFIKKDGILAMTIPGLMKEFENGIPEHLKPFWGQDCWCWHMLKWWRHLWERTGLVEMIKADTLENGCDLYAQWKHTQDLAGFNPWPQDTEILKKDAGEYVGFIRLAAKKK